MASPETGPAWNRDRWVGIETPPVMNDLSLPPQGEEFLYQSTEVKNIWLPMGEMFAN